MITKERTCGKERKAAGDQTSLEGVVAAYWVVEEFAQSFRPELAGNTSLQQGGMRVLECCVHFGRVTARWAPHQSCSCKLTGALQALGTSLGNFQLCCTSKRKLK